MTEVGFELHFTDGGNRKCGGCTLCCKLVPVEALDKRGGQRCRNQTHKGCRIYAKLPELVPECRFWSCAWLSDPDAAMLRRPDRCHFVVDVIPDAIGRHNPETGEVQNVQVVQVWIDPAHPEAKDDPHLRAYLELRAKRDQCAALIRWNEKDAIAIFAPCLSNDGQWHEMGSAGHGSSGSSGLWENPFRWIKEGAERQRGRAL